MDITTKIHDGPLPVGVIASKNQPWATIDLDDKRGGSYLTLNSPADCDRLIVAAVIAKRMLELSVAGTVHAFERGAGQGGHRCVHCGQMEGGAIHAVAAPCNASGCGHAKDSHWEIGEPDGPRTGCAILGCACTMYAATADVAAYRASVAAEQAARDVLAESIASGAKVIIDEDVAPAVTA